MQDFKSRSSRRTAGFVFIALCGACNALLDNHPRDLKVVTPGAGGTAVGAAGEGGPGGSEPSAGEAGMSGASGSNNEGSEGGAAGDENEPAGGRGGSSTGGAAGMSYGGTSQGGTSQGGTPGCTGCTPGASEPQTRACGICNAGKESGTRTCTPSCTWETSWSGVCSDHGDAKNGCSLVKWCGNESGHTRTECTLLGCTATEAENECRKEAPSVCGTVRNLLMNTQCP